MFNIKFMERKGDGVITRTYLMNTHYGVGRIKLYDFHRERKWQVINFITRTVNTHPDGLYTIDNNLAFWNEYLTLKRLEDKTETILPRIIDEYTRPTKILCTKNIDGIVNASKWKEYEFFDIGYALAELDSLGAHLVDTKIENFGRTIDGRIFAADFEHSRWTYPNMWVAGFGLGTLRAWTTENEFLYIVDGYTQCDFGKNAMEDSKFNSGLYSAERLHILLRPLLFLYRNSAERFSNH